MSRASVKPFKWNKHDDAQVDNQNYRIFERRLSTNLKQAKGGPRVFLLEKDEVNAKLGRGVADLEWPEAPDDPNDQDQEDAYNAQYDKCMEEVAVYEKKLEKVQDQFTQAIGDIEDLFDLDCEARTLIDNVGFKGNPRKRFNAIRKALKAEFEPSKTRDASRLRKELMALTDCGMTWACWVAEHTRLRSLLEHIGQMPSVREIEEAIIDHVHNPHLCSFKDKLVVASAKPLEAGEVSEYPYEMFIKEGNARLASFPMGDKWGVNQREARIGDGLTAHWAVKDKVAAVPPKTRLPNQRNSGGTSGGGSGGATTTNKNQAGVCWRCGRPGHSWEQCDQTSCAVCGVNIGKLPPGNNKRDHSSGKCVPNVSTATKLSEYF